MAFYATLSTAHPTGVKYDSDLRVEGQAVSTSAARERKITSSTEEREGGGEAFDITLDNTHYYHTIATW